MCHSPGSRARLALFSCVHPVCGAPPHTDHLLPSGHHPPIPKLLPRGIRSTRLGEEHRSGCVSVCVLGMGATCADMRQLESARILLCVHSTYVDGAEDDCSQPWWRWSDMAPAPGRGPTGHGGIAQW